MRIISTRLMPRVCGIHRQKPKALGLKFGCGFTWHLSIKVLRLRECCGVPWRAFFFAVMGCSGLARTGIGPIYGFKRHFRQSPLTDPWEPLYSKRTDKAVIIGL